MAKTIQYFRLATKKDKNTIKASQLKDVTIELKTDSTKRIIKLEEK